MVNALFEKGREGFLDGTIDWDAVSAIKAMLMDPVAFTDTGVKAITAASNATPIVITSTAHGFTNGDFVYIDQVGGNLAANGFWKIANVAANTFELQRPDGTNAVGSAAYTSGGYAINYGPSASGDNLDDLDGTRVGTDQTLTSPTVTAGVADAADSTFPSVSAGNTVRAIALYKDTGTASTSRVIGIVSGKAIVTCSKQAAASATSVDIEPLTIPLANGAVLTFSNGASATLSAVGNVGDRTLTVTALAAIITVGSRALGSASASGLPVATNGGSIVVTWDNGANRIFKL
jgi:hypothetical protein